MNYTNKIRNSKQWAIKSKEIKLRDNNLCQICLHLKNERTLYTIKSVHHIKKLKYFPELAFISSNLITLCSSCHKKIDMGYTFTDTEDNIVYNIDSLLEEIAKGNDKSHGKL